MTVRIIMQYFIVVLICAVTAELNANNLSSKNVSKSNQEVQLSEHYFRNGDKIEYRYKAESGHEVKLLVAGANAPYFLPLETSQPLAKSQCFYGKDKKSVYFRNLRIKGAKPESFEILGEGYARDESKVYFEDREIKEADPLTFKVKGEKLAIDKNNLFDKDQVLTGIAEPATYKKLGPEIAKDSKYVYYKNNKLEAADAGSFELLLAGQNKNTTPHCYYKDKSRVYLYDQASNNEETKLYLLENIDLPTFQPLPIKFFSKDSIHVYFKDKPIIGADPVTFRALDYEYSKDKNNVYYQDQVVKGAHVPSFIVVKNKAATPVGADDFGIFFRNSKVEGADPDSFYVMTNDYFADNKNVYYRGQPVPGADVKTFMPDQASTKSLSEGALDRSVKENMINKYFYKKP